MSRLAVFGVVAAVAIAAATFPVQADSSATGLSASSSPPAQKASAQQPGGISSPAVQKAASATATDAAGLAQVVGRVQKAYAGLGSLAADFEQTSRLSAMSKPRVDTGTVEFKKGGKMRWDFLKPESRQFISDGKTLWIYSPGDNQVIVSQLQSGASQTAMNFMFGLGDLTKEFSTVLATESEYQRPGMSAIHLTPKESIGTLKRLTVLVSDQDGVIREAYVQDQMSNTTHLVFRNLKLNGAIADGRFQFEAPRGVDVIQPQGF